MLKVTQVKIPVKTEDPDLKAALLAVLKLPGERLISWRVARRSIEARKKEELSYVYSFLAEIKGEAAYLKKNRNKNITRFSNISYSFPKPKEHIIFRAKPPIVTGAGPAGLFCAYFLARAGLRPVVLERGGSVEERIKSVETFWAGGPLDPESNVQFGEGGAGAFSDGKLNSGISDRSGRVNAVLKLFVKYGAPCEILYDAMPHVGTNIIRQVVKNMRDAIVGMGGSFRFNSRVDDIVIKNGVVSGVSVNGDIIPADAVVLAIGHSARDTFGMLYAKGVSMTPKPFAVGLRIQHPQELINKAQWGDDYPAKLGSAAYKLSCALADGRSVYTFCMCPGGYVVNASSEQGALAVNGMSYSGRDSGAANGAVVISVSPRDLADIEISETPDALKGIAFQRKLEKAAFLAANGKIPAQSFGDFRSDRRSSGFAQEPKTKGAWDFADLKETLPSLISNGIESGIIEMGKKLERFDDADALLMGVESRTSSPVRITRDENFQSNIQGLYPAGEGAGYAGGITSAAVDGIKIAEAVLKVSSDQACQSAFIDNTGIHQTLQAL